jgi:predicted DNA-binding antitoxin AbrB/MazE fold protein
MGRGSAIDALYEEGALTPAHRIRFANGETRVCEGRDRFRLGRSRGTSR